MRVQSIRCLNFTLSIGALKRVLSFRSIFRNQTSDNIHYSCALNEAPIRSTLQSIDRATKILEKRPSYFCKRSTVTLAHCGRNLLCDPHDKFNWNFA